MEDGQTRRELVNRILERHKKVPAFKESVAARELRTATGALDLLLVNLAPARLGLVVASQAPDTMAVGKLLGHYADLLEMTPQMVMVQIARACAKDRMADAGVEDLDGLLALQCGEQADKPRLQEKIQKAMERKAIHVFLATAGKQEETEDQTRERFRALRPMANLLEQKDIELELLLLMADKISSRHIGAKANFYFHPRVR